MSNCPDKQILLISVYQECMITQIDKTYIVYRNNKRSGLFTLAYSNNSDIFIQT